ncbi:MAG: PEP-CTERM sorting domain-containing protein [Deltaproteobacteria bacterium]
MKKLYFSLITAALLLYGQSASAVSVGTETYAGVSSTVGGSSDFDSSSTGSSSSVSDFNNIQPMVMASGFSYADFGTNRASSGTLGSTNTGAGAYSHSFWADEFVITGGSGIDTAWFGFSLDGTLSATGQAGSSYDFVVEYDYDDNTHIGTQSVVNTGADTSGGTIVVDYTSGGSGLLWGSFDFYYDESFFISSVLYTSSWAGSYSGGGSSYSDFYTTAALSEIILPTGSSLTATSGTDYTGSQSTVPEPSTLFLLGAGIGGFALIRRSFRRK